MYKITSLVIVLISLFLFMAPAVKAEIRAEIISYSLAGQPFQGYLSYDDSLAGKRPGVIIVHEWWGHNEYARKRADMLARLGYTAFALDMYGAGKLAKHPEDAKKFMQQTVADMNIAEVRFKAAMEVLGQHHTVSFHKIAAIGYCFGGGVVLHMARVGAALSGVVSFHGSLVAKSVAQAGQVKAKVLVLNGADDPFVTSEQIVTFKQEMKKAGANLEFVNYPGVKHSFTNPEADALSKRFNLPLAYDAESDVNSWQRMQVFLGEVFLDQNVSFIGLR